MRRRQDINHTKEVRRDRSAMPCVPIHSSFSDFNENGPVVDGAVSRNDDPRKMRGYLTITVTPRLSTRLPRVTLTTYEPLAHPAVLTVTLFNPDASTVVAV